jgi:Orotidine 5'-phosphate decarboxylase / HUMPS family
LAAAQIHCFGFQKKPGNMALRPPSFDSTPWADQASYNQAMTFLNMLTAAENLNQSMLCVGLDPDPAKFPGKFKGDANKIYDFCAAIVDATADLVIAFKPQIAYFAAHRAEGQLERLMEHMRRMAPQVPVILDAKRGDIGSTAEQYAIEAFERYGADAVTLSPLKANRCFTNTWPAWHKGLGTSMASSVWWWAPPTRQRSSACARLRPRCHC